MPMVAKASIKVSRFSKTGIAIINTNLDGKEGYVNTFHNAIQPALMPGHNLDALNRTMLGMVAVQLDDQAAHKTQKVKLLDWARYQMTRATTDSVYGPGNPFRDSAINNAFW